MIAFEAVFYGSIAQTNHLPSFFKYLYLFFCSDYTISVTKTLHLKGQ